MAAFRAEGLCHSLSLRGWALDRTAASISVRVYLCPSVANWFPALPARGSVLCLPVIHPLARRRVSRLPLSLQEQWPLPEDYLTEPAGDMKIIF